MDRITLEKELKLNSLERLVNKIRRVEFITKWKHDWKELYGLRKNLWKVEDSQEYVNSLGKYRVMDRV